MHKLVDFQCFNFPKIHVHTAILLLVNISITAYRLLPSGIGGVEERFIVPHRILVPTEQIVEKCIWEWIPIANGKSIVLAVIGNRFSHTKKERHFNSKNIKKIKVKSS